MMFMVLPFHVSAPGLQRVYCRPIWELCACLGRWVQMFAKLLTLSLACSRVCTFGHAIHINQPATNTDPEPLFLWKRDDFRVLIESFRNENQYCPIAAWYSMFPQKNDEKLKFSWMETKAHLPQHTFHISNRHCFLTTIKLLSENKVSLKSKV